MGFPRRKNFWFLMSCTTGLLLSCYAFLVEYRKEKNTDYKAYCDISEFISCTKAFSSKYGKGFGIIGLILGEDSFLNQPNSVGGIFFYLALAVTCWSENKIIIKLQLLSCVISNLLSLYLAYILYYILYDFCIVCIGTYFVNAFNLGLCIQKWTIIKGNKVSCSQPNEQLKKMK